jgi:hydroxyacylglutathione hydrolase
LQLLLREAYMAVYYLLAMLELHRRELPPIGTWAYCLLARDRQQAIVIDAPEGAYKWASQLAESAGCQISALLLTHGHWDHTLDAHAFAGAGIPVYAHREDKELIENPAVMADFVMPGMEMKPARVSHWVEAGQSVELLGQCFEVRHVPGHCPGNVLFYDAVAGRAFVGDVIFCGSVGRFDLPGGDFATLQQSIKSEVYSLPDATVLLPGHGPETTVAEEKAHNPYVRP